MESAQNRKKTKRFMISTQKKGGHFLDISDPPPSPPLSTPLPQNLKKVSFKWGGSGGVRTKNSLGDVFIGQNNDFTRG